MIRSMMNSTVVLLSGHVATPLYLMCLILATIYKLCGHAVLWLTCPGYDGLLNLMEAFFDREPGSNLNVINLLGTAKLTKIKNGEDFRRVVIRLCKKNIEEKKMVRVCCVTKQFLGLRYWQSVPMDYENQIRLFEASSQEKLADYLSSIANQPIHGNRLWEMHVSKYPLDGAYPVIMRAHHTLGDGYAIRKVLMDAQTSSASVPEVPSVKTIHKSKLSHFEGIRRVFHALTGALRLILLLPSLCIAQYLKPVDENSLRNENMSGRKILRWTHGELRKLKEIQKITGSTITEILLTALSKSLDDLFKRRNESVQRVTVAFPFRVTQETKTMANEFIPVAIQLPIDTRQRQKDLSRAYRRLTQGPAYAMNYFLPRFLALLCHLPVPRWAYRCTEMTCIFSNLPGPKERLQFDGFEGVGCHFFVPNLPSNNGLGISVSSFAERITYSVIMDESVMNSEDDAQKLADGILEYIETVHKSL